MTHSPDKLKKSLTTLLSEYPPEAVASVFETLGLETTFDIQRSLQGTPVVLNSGVIAYIRHKETDVSCAYPLVGVDTKGSWYVWNEEGMCISGTEKDNIRGMYSSLTTFIEKVKCLDLDISYVAMDKDGSWWGYVDPPVRRQEKWISYTGLPQSLSASRAWWPTDTNWEDSLTKIY